MEEILNSAWCDARSRGLFRYQLHDLPHKILPGNYNFVLQLNSRRSVKRRRPQAFFSLDTPFNENTFNFTQASPEEILFYLRLSNEDSNNECEWQTQLLLISKDRLNQEPASDDLLMINVSPLDLCHYLIVPKINDKLPQQMTEHGIRLTISLLLQANSRCLRAGFNSICALASVNHQHLHVWKNSCKLLSEDAAVVPFVRGLFRTVHLPCPAYMLQSSDHSVPELSRLTFLVCCHLQKANIAHNLFITFGCSATSSSTVLRIYIFPRKSFCGEKNEDSSSSFNIAAAELGGQVPVYDEQSFQIITEDDICHKMSQVRLDAAQYEELDIALKKLFHI